MPSALRASRDFVAQAVARVRSGLSEYERNTRLPGPEITVEPFDAQNVSTPAALIKLGTSISASNRRRANMQEAQKDVELTRERTRASIALLRAQAERQGQTREAATLTSDVGPYKAGMPISDINVDLANRRLDKPAGSNRNQNAGRVSAAQAGLRQIDARIAQDADARTQEQMVKLDRALRWRILHSEPEVSGQAAWALGIDPKTFSEPYPSGPAPGEKANMVNNAFAKMRERVFARIRAESERRYASQRQRYQSVIDEGVSGFGAAEPDPGDPLGLGINPLGLFEDAEEESFETEELVEEEAP